MSKERALPTGWIAGCLGEFIEPRGDRVAPADFPDAAFIGMDNVESHSRKILGTVPARTMKSSAARFSAGDVLYGRLRPYLNKVVQPSFEGLASAEFIVFSDSPVVRAPFLKYRLNSADFVNFASHLNEGDRPRVSFDQIADFPLLLPPPQEQLRIVAKLEELFSELDKGVESLAATQRLLDAYRHALLKSAFEGRLTTPWRQERRGQLETGAQLRKRILDRRRSDWEAAELRRLSAKGSIPKNDRWRLRYKRPVPFEAEGVPSLPEEWCWISLDELVSGIPRSMQSGPFGSNLKHSEFVDDGVLVVGIDNVLDGQFSLGSQHRISKRKFSQLKKYAARPGDLLITVMASLGRSCVVPRDLETAIITKHVYRISMPQDLVLPEFFNLLLQSPTVSRTRMFKNARGQTRPGLNSSILRALPVPLCSIEEQHAIVAGIGDQLSWVDNISSAVADEIQRSTTLRHSIFKKAFSGQLVPQVETDEPASVALQRMRADERATAVGRNIKGTNQKKGTTAA